MPSTNKGFTLIELMVTMAILGIIASIALPAYTGYIKAAKLQEGKRNLASLRLAEEEYFLENNTYFSGTDTADLASQSLGLWSASNGSNGSVNFNYVATGTTSTWNATATGLVGTAVDGEIIPASK
jgi:type IV pilus assembly protein PilE